MSIYDARIQEEWQEEYNRKLEGELYTVKEEKKDPPAVLNCLMQSNDYEFTGVEPNRKIIYKYHPIKVKDLYEEIYNKLSDLINQYPNLLTIKLDKKDKYEVYGFDIHKLSTELYFKWFKNIDPKIDVYTFDISKEIFNDNMNLPFVPDERYQFCYMQNVYIDKFGELYITVTRQNNGCSLFGTLHIIYDLYNVRDIEKTYWLEQVYKCLVCLETYLQNINYKE